MTYGTVQIGVTGPSERIGGSSEYHIDTRFRSSMPFEDVRDRFDALAERYGQDGRQIEFSNDAVASQVYSLDMTPEERLSLLQRAAGAHSHRPGWHAFDYYAPTKGKGRWDSSSEGAPIYVVGGEGLSVEGHQGPAYGNFGVVVDKDGNVISKSGHGDNSQSVFGGGTISLSGATPPAVTPVVGGDGDTEPIGLPDVQPPTKTPQQEAVERTQNYAKMSKAELDTAYDAMRNDPAKASIEGMKMHKAYFNK